jgi:hypothetical protein
MSPVRYELSSFIPEDGILHSHNCKITRRTAFFNPMFSSCLEFRTMDEVHINPVILSGRRNKWTDSLLTDLPARQELWVVTGVETRLGAARRPGEMFAGAGNRTTLVHPIFKIIGMP